MKKILLIATMLIAGSASAQSVFNVPVQPPEMRPGYGLNGEGLHLAVPYGKEGVDCVANPVSMTHSLNKVEEKKLVAGQVFSIPVNVLFDFDKDFVRPEGKDELQNFYDKLVAGEAEGIRIVGNTDAKGTDEYNLDLGLRRAGAVATVLTEFGFDSDSIEIDTAGESNPVAPNTNPDGSDNPEGRQLNRRVDIEITKVKDKEVVTTKVVLRDKNPQIFHRLASNFSVGCGGGVTPQVAIPISGNDDSRLNPGEIVITTVPR